MHHPKNIKSNGLLSAICSYFYYTSRVKKLSYEMCLKAGLKKNILIAL